MEILASLPQGSSELMTHPGLVDDQLRAESKYNVQREDELAVLTNPQVIAVSGSIGHQARAPLPTCNRPPTAALKPGFCAQPRRSPVSDLCLMKNTLPRRVIKFGFHLLYHELAFTYDAVAWLVSLGQWQAWGRTALDRVRGPRVLEIGHGPGHLLIALARSGRQPIGIDLSPADDPPRAAEYPAGRRERAAGAVPRAGAAVPIGRV